MSSSIRLLVSLAWAYLCFCKILPRIALEAYKIRLLAIEEYGPIIHEFDPYFNFRATEYLYEHGAKKILHLVRLYGVVSSWSPRWNNYIPRYAVHCSMDQELHCWR